MSALLRRRRPKHESGGTPSAGATYTDLRALALGAVANGLAPPRDDHPNVSGVVIDITATGGSATLVSLTDNTTSMYTSGGGGTIGGGGRSSVASATRALLAATEQHLALFTDGAEIAMPPPGTVRFHVLTPGGGRTADVPEDCFWGRSTHQLMPVIAAAQQVLTSIREASPE